MNSARMHRARLKHPLALALAARLVSIGTLRTGEVM